MELGHLPDKTCRECHTKGPGVVYHVLIVIQPIQSCTRIVSPTKETQSRRVITHPQPGTFPVGASQENERRRDPSPLFSLITSWLLGKTRLRIICHEN
jgi:hypothetical protein